MSEKPLIGVSMGDPAGIGPEIALKAAVDPAVRARCCPVVIGSASVLERVAEKLGLDVRLLRYDSSGSSEAPGDPGIVNESGNAGDNTVHVLDLANCPADSVQPGTVSGACGRAAYEYVAEGVARAMKGEFKALVTGPIHKVSLSEGGVPYPGHTEILAALTGAKEYAMMLVAGSLRVSHVTTHIPLSQVPGRITQKRVHQVIELTHRAVRGIVGKEPRLAVAALNPHAGEGGLFGDEDERVIRPAVELARSQGMLVEGPIPADTVFVKAKGGRYDAVVAMYHDQGHIPVKLAGFDVDPKSGEWVAVRGVNVTLGLPIVRTSVDHGTAFDIAWQGIARHDSLCDAIALAVDLA